MEDGKTFKLLDGDKIAVMVAMFFVDLVNKTKLSEDKRPEVGVVQTAYANGSSTKYLRSVSHALPSSHGINRLMTDTYSETSQ